MCVCVEGGGEEWGLDQAAQCYQTLGVLLLPPLFSHHNHGSPVAAALLCSWAVGVQMLPAAALAAAPLVPWLERQARLRWHNRRHA